MTLFGHLVRTGFSRPIDSGRYGTANPFPEYQELSFSAPRGCMKIGLFKHPHLHKAIEDRKPIEYIRFLLRIGFNVHALFYEYTPLAMAALCRNYNSIGVLLEHGADPLGAPPGRSYMSAFSISFGDDRMFCLLFRPAYLQDKSGQSLLQRVISGDHIESARLLLFHGADPNELFWNRWTPLHHVRSIRMAKLLLSYGATWGDFDPINMFLKSVIDRLPLEFLAFLIEIGVDPHGCNLQGHTLQEVAFRHNRTDVLCLL